MNNPKFQLTNPPFKVHGFEPRPNLPGHVMIEFELPNLPPIKVEVYFERKTAEMFMDGMRKCLDIAKGLKPT